MDRFGNGFVSLSGREISPPRREIARYLGYQGAETGEEVRSTIEEVCERLSGIARPAAFWRIYGLSPRADGETEIQGKVLSSRHLARALAGCSHCILLAATLGMETDRELRRLGLTDITRQVILQAAAAACLEEFLDRLQERLRCEAAGKGLALCARFSPGYGDFPLSCQRWIFQELDCGRRLGITLTENCIMIPSKSVTALIGVYRPGADVEKRNGKYRCGTENSGCPACGLTACLYQKTGQNAGD